MILLSTTAKHLLVDISAHGFGHLVQAASVLNALNCDDIKLTIRSMAPIETLNERIRHPFDLIRYQQDNGMVMYDALRVDIEKSMEWYRDFHSNYNERKSIAAKELEALSPDMVFSNVPYLGLDAASLIDVPSVALCSLNWSDIFDAYCGHYPDAQQIHSDISNAYTKASVFLQPEPSMPMESLSNTQPISPIAFTGRRQPKVLRAATNCNERMRFVLIGVGGVGIDNFPLEKWPKIEDVTWIFPDNTLASFPSINRDDFVKQSQFDVDYIDLLSSCNLVLTKTGYGTQTEAVVNQVPTICICRHDWPEHTHLSNWHKKYGEVEFIEWEEVGAPKFSDMVIRMLGRTSWTKEHVVANGAKEAADVIYKQLFNSQ